MKIQVNGYTVDVEVGEDVKSELTQLGIDVDKEVLEGIEKGLSDGPDHGFDRAKSNRVDSTRVD